MRLADGSYSGAALLLATGGALLAGAALGYTVALRTLRRGGGGGRRPGSRALMPSLNLSGLGSWESSSAGGSGWATPSETPRTGSGSDLAAMNVKMALIVRQDIPLAANKIVQYSAWTVLGMFKKLYKRRDPGLKTWDVSGQRLEVLLAPSEDELMAVQAKARALGMPTHTFAGRDRSQKQRSVMAVGPAEAEALRSVVGHLREL